MLLVVCQYSGLRSPGRSNSTYFWNDFWVQTFHRFRLAKQQLCPYFTPSSCTFLCRHCTTTTWNFPVSRFSEDAYVDTRQRLSFSFLELQNSPWDLNSRIICQHLPNWTRWIKRDWVWSSANSLFKWRFRCRRRRCCLSSLFCLKLQWSGQQKRATCFATLLQNELKSDVCAVFAHVQTCLATNQVVASCVNSNFFLHGSYVTFAKTFALDWQSAQHLPILLKNVELYCPLSATIIHNLQQPDLLQDKFELEFDSFCSSVWKQQAARFFFSVKINRLSDCVSFIKVKTLSRGTILSILF